jgi:uncharacterized protein
MIGNLLIWMAIAIGGLLILMPLLSRWIPSSPKTLNVREWLPREALQLALLLIASIVVARREGVTLATYGLPARGAFGAKFWEGVVWGFAALSGLVGLLIALKVFLIDSVALAGASAWKYGAAWGVTFVVLGMMEEFFFRGYLLYRISTRVGFWGAAFLMSVSFGVAHLGNSGENALGIAQVFVFGLFACFALRRTGSLWFPIGYHAAWDWAQTYFYGTPDSGLIGVGHYFNSTASGPSWLAGGTGGPEGSVLSLVVLAISALYIHFRFPSVKYPLFEAGRDGQGASLQTDSATEPSH